MAKQSKNLQKVQDMLDGRGTGKIQVGYSTVEETRKVGDRWFDSEGREWEQKNGYRTNVTKLAKKVLEIIVLIVKNLLLNLGIKMYIDIMIDVIIVN